MTEQLNAYAIDANKRLEIERANNASATSLKFLENCARIVNNEATANFLAECNVETNFFTKRVNAAKMRDMKSLDRSMQLLQYARDALAYLHTKSCHNVVATAIKLHDASLKLTTNDARASLTTKKDKRHEVAKEREQYIVRSDKMIEATARQASMTLLSLLDLNVIREVSKDTFEFTDTAIARKIIAKMSSK